MLLKIIIIIPIIIEPRKYRSLEQEKERERKKFNFFKEKKFCLRETFGNIKMYYYYYDDDYCEILYIMFDYFDI